MILATLKSIKLKNGKDAISIYNRDECNLHINPSGKFIIGGPQGDAGLTGRKIIIDTYGGWGAHGGGAFSGKDPTKVDRSAAYACRWMAKSVVKSGLAKRACVQLSYAIGVAKPLSLFVETYGTEQGELTAAAITDLVKLYFDCRPGALARDLTLRQPKYNVTAAYCHFGREPYAEGDLKFFSWEDAKDLSKYAGMKAADRWGIRGTPTGIRPFSHKATQARNSPQRWSFHTAGCRHRHGGRGQEGRDPDQVGRLERPGAAAVRYASPPPAPGSPHPRPASRCLE